MNKYVSWKLITKEIEDIFIQYDKSYPMATRHPTVKILDLFKKVLKEKAP